MKEKKRKIEREENRVEKKLERGKEIWNRSASGNVSVCVGESLESLVQNAGTSLGFLPLPLSTSLPFLNTLKPFQLHAVLLGQQQHQQQWEVDSCQLPNKFN